MEMLYSSFDCRVNLFDFFSWRTSLSGSSDLHTRRRSDTLSLAVPLVTEIATRSHVLAPQ